jgi:hypothetical protein
VHPRPGFTIAEPGLENPDRMSPEKGCTRIAHGHEVGSFLRFVKPGRARGGVARAGLRLCPYGNGAVLAQGESHWSSPAAQGLAATVMSALEEALVPQLQHRVTERTRIVGAKPGRSMLPA